MIDGPIGFLLRLLNMAHDSFSSLVDFFDTPIADIFDSVTTGNNFIDRFLELITDVITSIEISDVALGDITILSLLFGASLSLFVIITIGKWVLGLRY